METIGSFLDDLCYRGRFLEAVTANGHGHADDVVHRKSGIDRLEFHKRSNEQRCTDDQHYSKSHLSNDKRRTKLAASNANTGVGAIFIQSSGKIRARCTDRGHKAEDDTRKN